MRAPNSQFRWSNPATTVSGVQFDAGLRSHMLRVYNYMAIGLVVTGIVSFVVGTTPALYVPIFSSPLQWVVMLAPLAFVLFFSFKINSISAGAAQALFWAFSAVMGLSLASIFLVFTDTSIVRTFFAAAAMFGATSLYGYTTKRDLIQFGSLLIMGLIGVIVASIKEQYAEHAGAEAKQKLAVMGALSLYLNFINIFQLLLQLTGQREE
jgi:FtsH-binding integral membrane protein